MSSYHSRVGIFQDRYRKKGCLDKCGLNKRNNYNKGKEGHKVPACPEKKEKAIKEAFAHFGLV